MNAENVPAAAETCGPGEINVFENMNKVPRRIPTDSHMNCAKAYIFVQNGCTIRNKSRVGGGGEELKRKDMQRRKQKVKSCKQIHITVLSYLNRPLFTE